MPAFKIALAQTHPIDTEPGPLALDDALKRGPFPSIDANLAKAEKYITEAVKQGAQVVVFPENGFQGLTKAKQQYGTLPGPLLVDALGQLAKKYNVDIATSIAHGQLHPSAPGQELPKENPFPLGSTNPGRISAGQKAWAEYLATYPPSNDLETRPNVVNTAIYIDGPSGKVLGRYNKQNLWHPEREFVAPGKREWPVFETRFGKAGMLICWDLSHPGAAQTISDQHADIIYAPTYWGVRDSHPMVLKHNQDPQYEKSVVHALCYARAFETETFLAMSNAGGADESYFMGGSGVWGPLKGKLAGLGHDEDLLVVEVNTDVLKDGREVYKIREDWYNKYGA